MWEFNQYSNLISRIMEQGEKRDTRAGPTYSLFGESIEIDTSIEFPLLRGRKMFYKPVLGELAAFFGGPMNISDFKKHGCNYWDSWGSPIEQIQGSLDLDYGNRWINFNGVNQLDKLVQGLKNDPTGRRHIVTGWDPSNLERLSLPCCHLLYQWYVRKGEYLDMIWYQRSVDVMVGLPSDIIVAAAWNAILAQQVGLLPGKIKMILADTHIYANHLEPMTDYMKQLHEYQKEPFNPIETLKCDIAPGTTMENFTPDKLVITGYDPKPAIKFELNV